MSARPGRAWIAPSGALALAVALALGCGDRDATGESETASTAPARKPRAERKDRGSASMKIGGVDWTASSATARVRGSKLRIDASRTERSGKSIERQELHLEIPDFDGPGDYETGIHGSRFIGVGLDAAKAEGGDDEATAAATEALSQAEHMMLPGAKVRIDSAGDDQISGTFSWKPPPRSNQPEITEGSFRAVRRD